MENSGRFIEKTLLNGDIYLGTFKGMLPHGKGKYTWSDGTVYEGVWDLGKLTGKGKIVWSSQATYEGDFAAGYLHGLGTLYGSDGSIYLGSWKMNIQHGLGKKQYHNSDIYEGSWKEGVHHGTGTYTWYDTGNCYIGNWKDGKMCGKGIMKWGDGDIFDGCWLNGLRHGSGIYKFAEGGVYIGTWSKGLKDGRGTFHPPGTKHPLLKKCSLVEYKTVKRKNVWNRSVSMKLQECGSPESGFKRSFSERTTLGDILRNSYSDEEGNVSDNSRKSRSSEKPCVLLPNTSIQGQIKRQVVYEREYMQGILMKENVRNFTEMSHKNKQRIFFSLDEVKKRTCVDIFKGHHSYYLMLNLQLGIRYTVGKITPVPMREVRSSDFGDRARIRMYFPRKGSQFTPSHYSIDFCWKDYCPMVFRNLREMFKLDAADYMMSICGDDGLRELPSPGKSGSIFYLSHDDRFVIKTLKKSELKVLLRMLPYYYKHVGEHENTLITKFFGLHQITLRRVKKIRFVVMGNMFCTELRIHKRYDLKGSTQGRITEKDKINEHTTLKDLDLSYEFQMDKSLRESLFKQISMDCMFLESQQIIDYSLLLGLHFRAPDLEGPVSVPDGALNIPYGAKIEGELTIPIPPKGLLLVTHEPNFVSRIPGPHIRGSSLRAFSAGDKEVDLFLPETGRLRLQLGVNMPAQAKLKIEQDGDVELFEVFDVIIYLGIIDILQEYNLKKKLEHEYKSMQFDSLSISAIEPKLYSKRFISFLERVFADQS